MLTVTRRNAPRHDSRRSTTVRRVAGVLVAGFLGASAQLCWAGAATAAVRTDQAAGVALAAVVDPPVDPPAEPVDPPVEPVDPPAEPVDPPAEPVEPPVEPPAQPVDPPVDPPAEPVEPPVNPVEPPTEPAPPVAGAPAAPGTGTSQPKPAGGAPSPAGPTSTTRSGSAQTSTPAAAGSPTSATSPSAQLPVFRNGIPTRTSDPLAAFRGTTGFMTPMAVAGTGAPAVQVGASTASRAGSAAAKSDASASPVSGSVKEADDDGLASPASSGPTLAIVVAGLLAAVAVMVGAAAWQSWRTDD